MRHAHVMTGAAAGLLVASALIVIGGAAVQTRAPGEPQVATVAPTVPAAQQSDVLPTAEPGTIAPAPTPPDGLERVEPRGVLSPLSQALPPKPKKKADWDGTLLFQPTASSAGALDAKGYKIVIAGVEPVAADETCVFDGQSWPCGTRAKAAFRAMLRSRAVTCKIPEHNEAMEIVVPCRVGKVDIGAWLVSNGWARATAGGTYAEAGDKAKANRKGVFGPGPSSDAPPAPATSASNLPAPPMPSADPPEPVQ